MNHIVLYHPAIPQNTGNIIRTCVATNTKLHLIKPLGFSLDEKSLKRAGLDYFNLVDLNIYEDWNEFLNKNDGEIYFLTRYAKKTYCEFNYNNNNKDCYFVLGHEHDGIDHDILKANLNTCIRIPMNENVRSLNLSNCAMLIIYEALRQQNFPNLSLVEVQKGENFLFDD